MLTNRPNIVVSTRPKKAAAKPKAQAAAVASQAVAQKRKAPTIVSKVEEGDEGERQARRDAATAMWRKVSGQE